MGVTQADSQLLFYAKKIGVKFNHTCTLGRLNLYTSSDQINELIAKCEYVELDPEIFQANDDYSESIFKLLGSKIIDSIDFSGYENATIIHDMNYPLHDDYTNKFNCIFDGGTLEHIFNFPVAIKNCMNSIKTGGHFIGSSPVNNQMGHGFYQFSPELYYRIFSEENGFRIIKMFVTFESDDVSEWYEVADPKEVNSRVTLVNNVPLSLRFIAQKIEDKKVFAVSPQQSDYVNTWNAFRSVAEKKADLSGSRFKYFYRKLLPYRVKVILKNLYYIYKKDKLVSPTLGIINSDQFKKIEL